MERTCSLSEAFWQEEDAVGVIEIILILVENSTPQNPCG